MYCTNSHDTIVIVIAPVAPPVTSCQLIVSVDITETTFTVSSNVPVVLAVMLIARELAAAFFLSVSVEVPFTVLVRTRTNPFRKK
jgi:hypothetical protein